jgi:hypothetical protein
LLSAFSLAAFSVACFSTSEELLAEAEFELAPLLRSALPTRRSPERKLCVGLFGASGGRPEEQLGEEGIGGLLCCWSLSALSDLDEVQLENSDESNDDSSLDLEATASAASLFPSSASAFSSGALLPCELGLGLSKAADGATGACPVDPLFLLSFSSSSTRSSSHEAD